MHYKLIDFNSNGVMLCFPCGGAAGELNTCCGIPPMITADQWGVQAVGQPVIRLLLNRLL